MTLGQTDAVLVEVDQRRRVSLGKIGQAQHDLYLASTEADGTIVLRPAVVMTEIEARFRENTGLVERIRQQRTDPDAYVDRPR